MQLFLKQKVFSIGESFTFFDEYQNPVYSAKGNFFAIKKRFELFNGDVPEILIERKIFSLMPNYKFINLATNEEFAVMKQRFSFAKKFEITTSMGKFHIDGSLFGYSFQIFNENNQIVTSMQKKYLSWGDAYEIDINEQLIAPKLVCAIMVAYDNAVHNSSGSSS